MDSNLLSVLTYFTFILLIYQYADRHVPYAYIFNTYKYHVVMNIEMIKQHNEKMVQLFFFQFLTLEDSAIFPAPY